MYIFCIITGFAQFVLMIYILLNEIKIKSPAVYLWATLTVMFGVPHLLTSFSLNVEFSPAVIAEAGLFVSLFCLLYILVRHKRKCEFVSLINQNKPAGVESDYTNSILEIICLFFFVLSMLIYLIGIVRSQGGILNSSWGSVYASKNDSNYVSVNSFLIRIIFAFSGLSFYYYIQKRYKLSALIILLFGLLELVTRNRTRVLPVFIFFITIFLCRIKKIRFKHLIIGSLIAVVSVYIIYLIRAMRWMGSLSNLIENFSMNDLNATVLTFLLDQNGELALRKDFYYFISKNNQFEGFNKGYTYIRMLLVYLPSRWSFGLKPEGFDLYMSVATGSTRWGGSAHPTLFGDCFGNFYWFGILLGIFWAFLANRIDNTISRQKEKYYKVMLYFAASYAYVVIARGSVYNGFSEYAWSFLILMFSKTMLTSFSKKHIFCSFKTIKKIRGRK